MRDGDDDIEILDRDTRIKLMTRDEVCAFFGNISHATLYRGIKRGVYPKQVRVGLKAVRWRKADVIAARRALFEEAANGRERL